MNGCRLRSLRLIVLSTTLLAACATPPEPAPEPAPAPAVERAEKVERVVKIDETAMLPLLGYFQLLQRMSTPDLVRERTVLAAIPQTPAAHVRMAMLLGLVRGPQDIFRAQNLLDGVLKSNEPAASSLHPLARVLSTQYSERLKLQMQTEKLAGQNDKLVQQLNESLLRSAELQEKLDALADIERSLPVRTKSSESLPGNAR